MNRASAEKGNPSGLPEVWFVSGYLFIEHVISQQYKEKRKQSKALVDLPGCKLRMALDQQLAVTFGYPAWMGLVTSCTGT